MLVLIPDQNWDMKVKGNIGSENTDYSGQTYLWLDLDKEKRLRSTRPFGLSNSIRRLRSYQMSRWLHQGHNRPRRTEQCRPSNNYPASLTFGSLPHRH